MRAEEETGPTRGQGHSKLRHTALGTGPEGAEQVERWLSWPKESRKKPPHMSPPVCLSTRTLFLPVDTSLVSLPSISVWKFTSTQLRGQGLVTSHWSSS